MINNLINTIRFPRSMWCHYLKAKAPQLLVCASYVVDSLVPSGGGVVSYVHGAVSNTQCGSCWRCTKSNSESDSANS